MSHFVCMGGCNGVSGEPGSCQAPECQDNGKALHECNCPDGQSHQLAPEEKEQ